MLQRFAELTMQLAEQVAREALEETTSNTENRPRRADPRLIFLRLSRTIRDTIILKIRLAAGLPPEVPRTRRNPAPPPAPEAAQAPAIQAAAPPEDPRRPHIIRYFREAIDITRQKRKTPITHQHIEDRINTALANDPHRTLPGGTILRSICKSLELPFYASRMHTDLLRPPRPI